MGQTVSAPGDGWNYAAVWEGVAERFGDEAAVIHGETRLSWAAFDRHANGVAQVLLAQGLQRQGKVALYLRNRPEFLETIFAAFKAALVPVNTNYRYRRDELTRLWDDADVAAVVFEDEFTEQCAEVRGQLGRVQVWLHVGDEDSCPDWAIPYRRATDSTAGRTLPRWGRSGDDLLLLCTGGTTGLPKGVMWRQDDLFRLLEAAAGRELPASPDAGAYVRGLPGAGPLALPASPLMHGTGALFALPVLAQAGCVVLLPGRSFSPVELLEAVTRHQVQALSVVGDAFARPIIEAMDRAPGRWDLSSLRVISSSGATFSPAAKEQLLRYATNACIVDRLGSSESGVLATAVAWPGRVPATGTFEPLTSRRVRVLDRSGRGTAGVGESGLLAVAGHISLGYYNDPGKSATTWVEIDGVPHVMSGDWAQVSDQGTITLLGRGSACINTAGEKVFPEEVEEILKLAGGVIDAAVVGVPDDHLGQTVVALVQVSPGCPAPDAATLVNHVKSRLARYKAPKRVFVVPTLDRGVNGKLDYRRLGDLAAELTAGQPSGPGKG